MLDDLVSRFREKGRERVEEMIALLDVLERLPRLPGAVERLARHFHGLAGLGATYGYPEVSRLGDRGEELLVPLVRANETPCGKTLAMLKDLVQAIERELR